MKSKFMRMGIFTSEKTRQINIIVQYNGKMTPSILEDTALALAAIYVGGNPGNVSNLDITLIRNWVNDRFVFSKHNYPYKNAVVEEAGEMLDYTADGCCGSFLKSRTIHLYIE